MVEEISPKSQIICNHDVYVEMCGGHSCAKREQKMKEESVVSWNCLR